MKKENKGFTIAELLVVVAIIGILVAVSIPIFAGQLRKARVATNKANIRAARAAGIAQYYNDEDAGKFTTAIAHAYYYYDTASGRIDLSNKNTKYYKDGSYDNTSGTNAYNTALKYNVCTYIMVYVSPGANEKGATIQTAPFYSDTSGDKPALGKSNNPYGPDPGSD